MRLLWLACALALGGCGDFGCDVQPLPGGALPADQTVEGGGQIRVTQPGFQKLTSLIPAAINDLVAEGFCVPQGEWGDPDGDWGTGTYYCNTNVGGACGSARGCDVDLHLDYVHLDVPDQQHLRIAIQLDLHSVVHMDYQVFGGDGSCDMNVDGDNVAVTARVVFDVDPTTGELDIHLAAIDDYDLSGVEFSNCGAISSFGNFARDFIESWFGEWVVDFLTPTIDDQIQGMLPDPLGVEGVIDLGSLLGGISPGTEAKLEARVVPGGYVRLNGGGMSAGLITGLNSDQDPSTRSPDLDSEPALCVPPMLPPDFAAAPALLPRSARDTFTLTPAGEFLGTPEPADDLAIGVSETTLDLAGHHAVTSGAMCLGVGSGVIRQLNLGTFGLLVPSLSLLGEPEDPILLVTRPQRALDFAIGDGTTASPSVSIHVDDLEVDVYAFLYERYVRALTMRVDLTIGVNLTFAQSPGEPATITPELLGISADAVQIEVINREFIAETEQQLEEVLPTIFDLAGGLLGDGLGSFEVPGVAGFTLNDLRVQHVTTSEDDFLALYASLAPSAALQNLAADRPALRQALGAFATAPTASAVESPAARIVSVSTPRPETIRAAVAAHDATRLPTVTIAVPAIDTAGRPLEHAWRLQGGLWRPYVAGDRLVIADRAFAWQAVYSIEIRSRVVGDYTTTSSVATVTARIDSVPPEIRLDEVTLDGLGLVVPARDLVSPVSALQYAWSEPSASTPSTAWRVSPALDRAQLAALSDGTNVTVWVKDEAGNVAQALVALPFHGQAGDAGCGCDSRTDDSGSVLILLIAALGWWGRRSSPPDTPASRKTPPVG
jgi:hypothetical protein